MRRYDVKIEIKGVLTPVGNIICDSNGNAGFAYDQEYLKGKDPVPISVSLPLQEERFTPLKTKNFFNGLLPEGFTRASVARWMHVDKDDYISLLYGLGQECLGAIQIADEAVNVVESYERLSAEQVRELANEGVVRSVQMVARSHLSLTGASGKTGLYYDAGEKEWYLPVGNAPSTHIVKQSHVRLDGIVTNEQLSLMTAELMKIDVPHSFIINTGFARDRDILFATERYDRIFDGYVRRIDKKPCPLRLHQEDFAQALGISAENKYEKERKGYLASMFRLLKNYSANPIEDQIRLWKMIIFDYLIGNTDSHIKNFSLLYGKDLKTIRLAPAYDLLSTTIYEESTRDMAFYIGEDCAIDRICEASFREAADEIGLGGKMAMRHFEDMCSAFEHALAEAAYMLTQMGFEKAADIREKILQTGGISRREGCRP